MCVVDLLEIRGSIDSNRTKGANVVTEWVHPYMHKEADHTHLYK